MTVNSMNHHLVTISGVGGTSEVGERGVAVAGLEARQDLSPVSTAVAGHLGAAITSDEGVSRAGAYGVAFTGKRGQALGGAGTFASASDGGFASVGDGGVARISGYGGKASAGNGVAYCIHNGDAMTTAQGTALVETGTATTGSRGIASVRRHGAATTGQGGLAVVWSDPDTPSPAAPDGPSGSILAGGECAALITFVFDEKTGRRRMVIGFVGPQEEAPLVQHSLEPGLGYRFDPISKSFERA